MSNIVVGRVSTKGWARTTEEKMRQLLDNYSDCAFSQSTVYAGHIRSWSYSFQQAGHDPELFCSLIKQDLEILYGDIFGDEVEVETGFEYEEGSDVIYLVTIGVNVRVDGRSYDLNQTLKPNFGE